MLVLRYNGTKDIRKEVDARPSAGCSTNGNRLPCERQVFMKQV
jgi:hypothetical protein